MFAKILATVVLTACAANTAREILTTDSAKEEKNEILKHGIKCATLGILASAALSCAATIFDKAE